MDQLQERRTQLLQKYLSVKEYLVKRGDTFTSIGLANNISTKLIKLANPYTGDVLMEDEILLLPSGLKDTRGMSVEVSDK
jgi:LysM repeat protein